MHISTTNVDIWATLEICFEDLREDLSVNIIFNVIELSLL